VQRTATGWRGTFEAMASPCEWLLEGGDEALAHALQAVATGEAWRIERKFSRYRSDSVVAALHAAAGGGPVQVCDETAGLLDFAAHCHALSGGLFDITSGVLRRAWRFDGGGGRGLPAPAQVAAALAHVGWGRLRWQRPWLTLPAGMEIDFGGLGKEYAVDRVLALLRERTALPLLVNFGGDLATSGPRGPSGQHDPCSPGGAPWHVGIERPHGPTAGAGAAPGSAAAVLELRAGALATSGDARRCIEVAGVRYGHILDPRSGWPVVHAPRSVTVAAPTCTEAGLLSTLAMLQGARAEAWLAAQGAPHWVWRDASSLTPSPALPIACIPRTPSSTQATD
jgi:thiamine biosynthesis lipoprotein